MPSKTRSKSARQKEPAGIPDPEPAGHEFRSAIIETTEQKRTRDALGQVNAVLKQQVSKRTADLEASEERYRRLIHMLPLALYTCDADGRLVLFNTAAAALWGRRPKPGRTRWCGAHRVFTPDGRRLALTRCPMATTLRLGEPVRDVELIVERPDGSRSCVLEFPDLIRDASGAVTGAVNVMVDITAQKVAEMALLTSQRNLRKLSRAVEQSPASVVITDPDGAIEYVNPRFTEVTGYSREEVMGKTPSVLKSGKHPAAFYRDLWKTIKAGRDWRGTFCNRKKDGNLYWEFAVIAPILDERGVVTHFASMMEDITERRKAVADLHDREERLRAILNTVAEAVITIDRKGTITDVNPAAERMFGYTPAEMLGQDTKILIPPPYRDEHDALLARIRGTGRAWIIGTSLEATARRKDGTVFPVELAVSEVDHMHLYTGVIRDITERKRLEAEVLRTADEERLRVAADLHDGICQELAGIHYLASLLLGDLKTAGHPLAGDAARIKHAITDAVDHTRQLARGMSPVVAEGNGLMHALRRLAETTAKTHRLRCSFECKAPVLIENPTVANQLYRIALEALSNAQRHGRAKRITLRLSETGGAIRLVISDNGRGLPPTSSRGRGMGLRVMKYRAGLIGGRLAVKARARGGTEIICQITNPHTDS